ncbi:MAG: tetratricopeptide repeat protein [Flavobacteriales bacterium]
MSTRAKQIGLLGLSLLIVVGFLFLPKQPASVLENATPVGEVDIEIEKAVQQIQMGSNPMEGILALRAISEENPENVDAQLWLGVFSMQSGQMDKAKDRFTRVLTLEENNSVAHGYLGEMSMRDSLFRQAIGHFELAYANDTSYHNGLFFIAKSYEELGDAENAIKYYGEYLPFAPDTTVSSRVNQFIDQLRNK